MKGLVLERPGVLAIRDIEVPGTLEPGPDEVRIDIRTVGICGSDVHYYEHGRIGDFVVNEPMILGHEASGVVDAVGKNVTHLAPGDRVCMEPGIPNFSSVQTLQGHYNLDPAVRFWATPPVHGCLTPQVVHPATLTYKMPDSVSFAEGALVEPLAVGVYAVDQARIHPGDIAVVTGAGTIGLLLVFAAIAGGCAEVIVSDVAQEKLALIADLPEVTVVDARSGKLAEVVAERTAGNGADVFFECSGSTRPYETMIDLVRPGGTIVLVGMPAEKVQLDVVALQVKEITVTGTFRYANVWDRALKLLGSGKIKPGPLFSGTYDFADSVAAFERAAEHRPQDVKLQINMPATAGS
ncbi:NAD(P)-dependent alcohol dehydrogenase [Tropicimonas sp. IMCC34043]|uniref:NAD(P)-dependent alcohol dehydrogenase n=1 Tax=Tropicimonas sp. IMCC34043 TaxID=2248760 RepID=UPI0018E5761C|nr:NAD(P)-dependent alcohol dehydrogenase [Tropicimonas sp. IMCC34043]